MNKPLKVGDILIAEQCCGFPDRTTKGKEYEVSEAALLFDGRTLFHIINDEGKSVMPVSTTFKLKEAAE